jgi:hypothetical protein
MASQPCQTAKAARRSQIAATPQFA